MTMPSPIVRACFLVVGALLLFAIYPSRAAVWRWKSVNDQGMGYVTGLVICPAPPYTVYIRTDVGGAYRFDRANDRWIPLTDMLDTNAVDGSLGVESIAVDPGNGRHVFVVMNWSEDNPLPTSGAIPYSAEVLESTNAGRTWRPTGLAAHNIAIAPNGDYRVETGERLCVGPKGRTIWFATRQNGLWEAIRETSGWRWTQAAGFPDPSTLPGAFLTDAAGHAEVDSSGHPKPNASQPGFTFIVPGAAHSGIVFVGVWGSGVWKSSDLSGDLSPMGGDLYPLRASVAGEYLYVSCGCTGGPVSKQGHVECYSATSSTWTDITPADTNSPYNGISALSGSPNVVMVARDNCVWRSVDAGQTWSKQTMAMGAYPDRNAPDVRSNPSAPPFYPPYASTGCAALALDPGHADQSWWTNGFGVAVTDDVEAASPVWRWRMSGLEELCVDQIVCPPDPAGADLIAAGDDMIGLRSASRDKVPDRKVDPVGMPANPAYKWANTRFPNPMVYPSPFPDVAAGTSIDYCAKHPDTVAFVGFHEWQNWPVYGISHDNGVSWSAFPTMPMDKQTANDDTISSRPPLGGQIAISAANPNNIVYAPGTYEPPQVTFDGGRSWQVCLLTTSHGTSPLQPSWANSISPFVSARILASDKADVGGKTFYYFDNGQFYRSNDGGATWSLEANGLPEWSVRPDIVSNPTKFHDIWMTFQRHQDSPTPNKLYHSTDGGKTFSTVPHVSGAEFVAFGKGNSASTPFLYLFGRVGNAAKDTMYVSHDLGYSWLAIGDPALNGFACIDDLAADMRRADLVYAAIGGRGVLYGDP